MTDEQTESAAHGWSVERAVLAIGAMLGTLCLAAALAAVVFDLRPLVFRSGSMSPTIHTGDLAVARHVPAAKLAVGDVVSVPTAGGNRVTHRIVSVTHRGDRAVLALKGDANSVADTNAYDVAGADRVLFSVPGAGRAVAWMAGPVGLGLIGGYVAWLLRTVIRRPRRPGGDRSGPHLATAATVAALVAMSAASDKSPWTLAAWTDDVGVSGTNITAKTVSRPATFTCGALGVLSVTFNWTAVAGATSYTVHYGSGGAQTTNTTSTSITITSALSGGTAWVAANQNFGSVTWTSVASVTRTYTVAVVSLCS